MKASNGRDRVSNDPRNPVRTRSMRSGAWLTLIPVITAVLIGCSSDSATPAIAPPTDDSADRRVRETVESALSITGNVINTATHTPFPPSAKRDTGVEAIPTVAEVVADTDTASVTATPESSSTPAETPNFAETQAAALDALMGTTVAATLAAQASATNIQVVLATAVAATLIAQAPPTEQATSTPTLIPQPTPTPKPVVTAPPAPEPPTSAANARLRLAFVRGDIGDTDILVITVDSGDLRAVADQSCDEAEPSWAPDGQTLFFQSDCGGSYDLYLVNVVSGARSQLTYSADLQERDADISPDGTRVAFRVNREHNGRNVDGSLWIMNINGAGAQSLGIDGRSPAWSPDGEELLFMSQRDGGWDLFLFNMATRTTQRLTSCAGDCRFPVWSPEGNAVANYFLSDPKEKERASIRIQAIGSNGAAASTLVTGDSVGRPTWSATGLIAFNSGLGLEVVNEDGSGRQVIVADDIHWAPAWSR